MPKPITKTRMPVTSDAPARYVVAHRELDAIMRLLDRLLDIRVTFFDMREKQTGYFHSKAMSAYCAARRQDRVFDQACAACDHRHLEAAKRTRDVLIYHCHNGLIEGVVPLYDKHALYLGAIVFGQLRDAKRPLPADANAAQRRLYRSLQRSTPERARDIGYLLKYVSEAIIERDLIRLRNRPWAETIERHVAAHPEQKGTLRDLALLIGRSPSFLTHHFQSEFGCSSREYVLRAKLEKARDLLREGKRVKDVAYELGFYDPFHFSRRFKAYWGVAPRNLSDAGHFQREQQQKP